MDNTAQSLDTAGLPVLKLGIKPSSAGWIQVPTTQTISESQSISIYDEKDKT